ncbi:glycosyltransferase family 9 protein [Flavobacterium sp. LaA7.5]|nr:glycosyltransferase family 9 protein [Flavobacterium salilacus subsp. altitudinum]
MTMLKTINKFRKIVMCGLTKNVGNSGFKGKKMLNKDEVKRVLICRPNHRLGNMLLITPLVQEVERTFPDCKIDLFVKGNLAPIIFSNYTSIDRIIKLPKKHFKELFRYIGEWIAIKKTRYDIVINVNKNSSSGRLSTKAARGYYKFFGDVDESYTAKYSDYCHIAKYPVYNFRYYLSILGITERENAEMPTLNLKLSETELAEGQRILAELVKDDRKTISIFTYATGNKCYSKEWWEDFYTTLQERYADEYNIVEILPVENVSQIDFKAPSFYSKDIREIASVIANTAFFIGADSGMMHLASASQTPTVGLFSITKANVYTPYNESSTSINTNKLCTNRCMIVLDKIVRSN